MAKQKDFNAFLSNIEPSISTVNYISSVQNNLRDYLKNHETYKQVHVQTFLSGSYAKHTSIRPKLYDRKRDVDIIVETTYTSSNNSRAKLQELLDVLLEKSVYSTAKLNAHSVSIELEGIEIDVVPVIRSDDQERFYIGTSDVNEWTLTDPKGHISWSGEVNANSEQKYKPLVKMLKWWRRTNCPEDVKYPKGLTLEKMIADNLPSSDLNTESYLIGSMQTIVSAYKEDYIDKDIMPEVVDPCLSENDLLAGYVFSDFEAFIFNLIEHLELIAQDGPTNETWRAILGTEFPSAGSISKSAFSSNPEAALNVSHRATPPWPTPKKVSVIISTQLERDDGTTVFLENNGAPIPKGCRLVYRALHSVKLPYRLSWQIVNTGAEAQEANCLRGGFEPSVQGQRECRIESTLYTGKHYVQCFVIKGDRCVAKSKEFIINIE